MAETQQSPTAETETNTSTVQSAQLSEASSAPAGSAKSSIDILLDITLPVTVRLGQTKLPIQNVLQLNPGSVVRLDKPIESPVELYIKDSKFATGSVVVVDGKFAIRIKEIISMEAAELDTAELAE